MANLEEDERCCGTGTCLIDEQGRCWCGQQWDGTQMCMPKMPMSAPASTTPPGVVTVNNAKD